MERVTTQELARANALQNPWLANTIELTSRIARATAATVKAGEEVGARAVLAVSQAAEEAVKEADLEGMESLETYHEAFDQLAYRDRLVQEGLNVSAYDEASPELRQVIAEAAFETGEFILPVPGRLLGAAE